MIKKYTVLLTCLFIALTSNAFAISGNLKINTAFAPPHNEPVIGDMVARYRVQVSPSLDWGHVSYKLDINYWGVQRWQTPDVVGHGIEAWENSDWSVDEWRYTGVGRVNVDLGDNAAFFVESKYSEEFRGHDSYYHLIGVEWSLR
jgi:hypothetical protein